LSHGTSSAVTGYTSLNSPVVEGGYSDKSSQRFEVRNDTFVMRITSSIFAYRDADGNYNYFHVEVLEGIGE